MELDGRLIFGTHFGVAKQKTILEGETQFFTTIAYI